MIDLPTGFLESALPIIKVGLVLAKVALMTQGLGGVVPNISDFLSDFDHTKEAIKAISDATKSLDRFVLNQLDGSASHSERIGMNDPIMGTLFQLIATAENGKVDNPRWMPAYTGLKRVTSVSTSKLSYRNL